MKITIHKPHHFYQRLIPCILLVLLFVTLIHKTQAQSPVIQWQKSIGTSNFEYGKAIYQTTDGGYITAGQKNSGMYIEKLTATGSVQWSKFLTDEEDCFAIQQTKDGGYIVGGGTSDFYIVKLDASGNKQWDKKIGGIGSEMVVSLQQTTDGGYIAAGTSTSNVTGSETLAFGDGLVVKLDASGNVQWQKYYGTTDTENLNSIRQTADGGYILAGSTHNFIKEEYQVWLVKINATGVVQWQKTMGGVGYDAASAIRPTADGGYIFAARSNSGNTGDVSASPRGGTDIWIVKLNNTGAIQWQKLIGGDDSDQPASIQQTKDGGYIISGNTTSSNSGDVGYIPPLFATSSIWIVKLSSSGTVQWQKPMKGSITGIDGTIQQTSDDGFIVIGTLDDNTTNGVKDFWLTKFGPACSFKPTISGNSTVNVGSSITLTGSASTGTKKWTSANSDIATVSSVGVVTGIGSGTVVITYTVTEGNCSFEANKTITVTGNSRPIIDSYFTSGRFGYSPFSTSFSATNVRDPDGDPITYEWDFGDGSPKSNAITVNHIYTTTKPTKTFKGTLKVSDNKGLSAIANFDIVVDYVGQLGCLKYSYFNNTSFSGTPTRIEPAAAIVFSAENIVPNRPKINNISIRYEGTITPSVSGAYKFTVSTTDGVRLWVDNQLVVEKWSDQSSVFPQPQNYEATVNLTQGKTSAIRLDYFQEGGNAVLALNWTVPNGSSKLMPFKACLDIVPFAFDPNKCYRFTALHSGKVMEIAEHSTANGVNIQQGTWEYSRRQVWRIKKVDDTYFNLVNGYSGKLADVKGDSKLDGGNIQQYQLNGGANQLWRFKRNTEGYFIITNKNSEKVIDVKGDLTTNGANIQQYTSNGGKNQQWTVGEIGCPVGVAPLITAQIFAFDGYAESNKSILTWVSNADNADYFIIEKLNDKGVFEKLHYTNAKPSDGNFNKNYYTYIDNQLYEEDNIYRLVLIADNTPPQYSDIKKVSFSKNASINIFPNPADEFINVDLRQYEGKTVALSVYNSVGLLVKKQTIEKVSAAPQQIDVQGFGTGSYLLRVQSEGKREVTRLFHIAK